MYLSATKMQCASVAFIYVDKSCADPESFVRGSPIFDNAFLVDERINIPLQASHQWPMLAQD